MRRILFHVTEEGGCYKKPTIYAKARLSPIRIYKYFIEDEILLKYLQRKHYPLRLQRERTNKWQKRLMKTLSTRAGQLWHKEQIKRWNGEYR